ncbi:MAG: metallophosphoesterase [Clostridiales bacterium]|nr:metallophosphoesterase [Clostridiales bacterium]
MKKFLALLTAVAQLGAFAPAVMAVNGTDTEITKEETVYEAIMPQPMAEAQPEYEAEQNVVVAYSSDNMTKADGETIYPVNTGLAAEDYNRYGITADTGTKGIWSVQRISSIKNIGVEGLRFASRTLKADTSCTAMTWDFTADTVNKPAAMNGSGYVYESEFAVQIKDDTTYIDLDLNGKDADGNSAVLGTVRFIPQAKPVNGKANAAYAYALDAAGKAIGNKATIKSTSNYSYDNAGEMLFIRVKLDFVNKLYSVWLVPRKDEDGEYAATEPSEENLLVENASMINKNAQEFIGFNYDIMHFYYGNAVWIKNVSVSEYTPEVIEATPIPTPVPTQGHEEGVALKIGVLSDLQYGRASQDSSLDAYGYAGKKFKAAAEQVIEKAGGIEQLDVLMIPGDITHNSNAAEYQAFVKDLEEVIPKGSHTKVMFVRGNHDAKDNKESNFVTYLSDYDETLTSPNNVYDIYGYKFITVSQDTQRANDESSSYEYIHSPETISWFDQEVQAASEEAAAEGKPIFVAMHPNVKDTVYGSFPVTGMRNGSPYTSNYWGTNELYDSLKNCQNAITFSGHSHWDMANERSIHQGEFTSLNTGAVNNMEIEDCWDESFQPKRFGSNENESSGYYIEVGEDNVVTVHRMDFYRNREFKEPWVINVNDKANWQYTDTRDTTAPYFTQDATAAVSGVSESGCKVTFTQAKDDDTDVGHYRVDIINQETQNTDKSYTVSSYYWQGDEAPAENYWNVSGLEPQTQYKAVITAYDSFYQESSNTIETEVFTTAAREVKPAALAKVSFNDSTIQDTSEYARFYDLQPRVYGSTPISYNSELKMYEASFEREEGQTGSPNFFKVMMDAGRKELMQGADGYTIDVMFSPSKFNGSDNVIGAAQGSGFDIETTADGTVEAYVRHNGAWVKDPYPGSTLTLEAGKYYHLTVTYDGENVKVYNNGVLADTHAASGAMEFYAQDDPNFGMVIGGDYNPVPTDNGFEDQTSAQNAFSGKIVFANLYNGAFTAKEVAELDNKYVQRASLTKADELNELLCGGTIENGALLNEGRMLMADEDLTDADIEAYINKVNSKKSVAYSMYADKVEGEYLKAITTENYGITANGSAIWSVVKENDDNTCYVPALRFSMKTDKGNQHMGRIDFAKDITNNPSQTRFEGGKYVYESEFEVLYKDSGSMTMTLKGRNASGDEKDIAAIKFAQSTGDYKNTCEAYFTDANGSKIGSSLKYKGADDNAKVAAMVLYARIELDMTTGTYSAYLVPRKTESGAYQGTEYSEKTKLVDSAEFINTDVKSLDAVSFDITNSAVTNIFWLNNIEISGENGDELKYVKASVSAEAATAQAQIENRSGEVKEMSLYVAQYDENSNLLSLVKADGTIADKTSDTISTDFTANEGAKTIKVMVWDKNMIPYAVITK